jgi:hypothetical protein
MSVPMVDRRNPQPTTNTRGGGRIQPMMGIRRQDGIKSTSNLLRALEGNRPKPARFVV